MIDLVAKAVMRANEKNPCDVSRTKYIENLSDEMLENMWAFEAERAAARTV